MFRELMEEIEEMLLQALGNNIRRNILDIVASRAHGWCEAEYFGKDREFPAKDRALGVQGMNTEMCKPHFSD